MFRIFAVLKMLQRMKLNVLKRVVLLLMLLAAVPAWAQKLITYEAGMGTRDPSDADVWILYQRVRAVHEGMVLHADSALLNTVLNDFTAFGHIKIEISDTTTIYGDQLYYDGMTRVLDIWDDTVKLIDGKTILKSDHLQYDRYSSTAVYDSWGKTVNEDKCLTSRQGYYNSDTKVFDIYDSVILIDSNMRLETDTLTYNTNTHIARFWSPTHIYTDSATMYSEHGTYNTDLRYAHSMKASEVHNGEKHITCDTLHYYEETEFGKAIGNVVMWDTVNEIFSTSRYAETSRENNTTFVTDSALVRFVSRDEEDTLAVPDTMYLHADSNGAKRAYLNSNIFCIEQVDPDKFNQVKGRNAVVYFVEGEPDYADVLGNAEMVYYLTEEDNYGRKSLIGVNVGLGSDMRIYFVDRAPDRVVTKGNPDMNTYPLDKLEAEKKQLANFKWIDDRRPKKPLDVFKW